MQICEEKQAERWLRTCALCGEGHSMDRCPQLGAASRFVRQSAAGPNSFSAAKAESKADTPSRKPFPTTDSTNVVVDDSMEVEETAQAPELHVLDPAMPAVPIPNTSRMRLFFVESMVQSTPMWILADSGSSRNLINEQTFNRLPFQPTLRSPGDVRVIGGSGEALHLKGFAVLPVSFGSTLVWHEFGVVKDLPLEALIGGDVFIPHFCTLQYLKNGRKRLEFGLQTCSECEHNRSDPESGSAVQLRYVDRELRRKRNRVKLKPNFVAVLPEKQSVAAPETTITLETHYSTMQQQVPTLLEKQVPDPQAGKLQKVLAELRVATLPIEENVRNQLIEIVRKQLDAFAATPTDLGRTSVIVHSIKTGEAHPFRHKLRAVPFAQREFLVKELERLQAVNAISPATPGECPYASRIVLVGKKDGSTRMCVDYRDLNAQTEKDSFPLPRIDDVWPSLSKAKCFASLDLLMGYHQVEVDSKDRYKTAFITPQGLFVFNVMPFGLCNAPATFQRLMERILHDRISRDVLVYLDDVLIFGPDPESVLASLRLVLDRLAKAGLKCKPSKCSIFSESVNYLGHVVSSKGIFPDPNKLDRIKEWPRPTSGLELASFLGFCNYYRDLVPDFAHLSDALYKKTRVASLEWTSDLDSAFQQLKTRMLDLPLIKLPDPSREFVLETDASKVAVGAVLKQNFDSVGGEFPVAFFSRALTITERNYSAYELEMYAVVRAVERFRVYLLGRPFLLRTDHLALVNLLKRDLPPTTRVQKWILRLSEYNFIIEHQKGTSNVMADILSRLPFATAVERSGENPNKSSRLSASPDRTHSPNSTQAENENGTTLTAAGADSNSSSSGEARSSKGLQLTFLTDSCNKIKQYNQIDQSATRSHDSDSLQQPDPVRLGINSAYSQSPPSAGISNYSTSGTQSSADSSGTSSDSESSSADEGDEEIAGYSPCAPSGPNTAMPVVDIPISREGLTEADFIVPTWSEFANAVEEDPELHIVKQWLETNRVPTPDELAAHSAHIKEYAQLREQLTLRDGLLFLRRADDPQRELVVVPAGLVERIIRYNHEGLGAAHQAAKATSARTLRVFYWAGLKRDIEMYVAACPVCTKFFRVRQLPKARLRPMDIGGRGECLAMDIVGGQGSLPLTARANRYILTMIDCFTRFAIAVPLPDQSSDSIISAVLGNYILIYGTPHRILSDQGTSFESESFHNFCKLFRIHKIRTSGYRPQSNGMCERFNQTLKSFLRKILSDSTRSDWDLYLNFAVFAYNTAEHSSTSFSPHFLTFGEEARLPADLVFGPPALSQSQSPSCASPDPLRQHGLSTLMRSFSLLSRTFAVVRENLRAFHRREKDRYDLGAVEHIFKPGDTIRVRLKTRFKGPAKFAPSYSGPHTVESVRGVILTVREHSTNRVYNIHHDRASNPVWVSTTGPGLAPQVVDTDANPAENEREIIEDSQPARKPEELLIRTRSGRVVRQRRDSDFEYQFPLVEFSLVQSSLHAMRSRDSTLASFRSTCPCSPANQELLALTQVQQAHHGPSGSIPTTANSGYASIGFKQRRYPRRGH